ncbi:hypothetical protein JCM19053_908 [Vibrio sp. JCM 19053]|nr:hypothetical protein JCM19053_908 [Vibrio sp. JCM 19053]
MRDKPKTEWTADNAVDFAKHCVLQDGVGSEQWCENLKDKPKGDWTANEATSFTKHCIFLSTAESAFSEATFCEVNTKRYCLVFLYLK